jgi:hypothetical protein
VRSTGGSLCSDSLHFITIFIRYTTQLLIDQATEDILDWLVLSTHHRLKNKIMQWLLGLRQLKQRLGGRRVAHSPEDIRWCQEGSILKTDC